jgi:lysophospholipase L1-like esterase
MAGFQNTIPQAAFTPVPNTYGQNLLHRAIAQMEAGVTPDRKVLLVGDSVWYGYAGTGTQPTAGRGPALAMAKYLSGLGIPAQVGLSKLKENGGLGNDARWVLGTGWGIAGGLANSSWGGQASGAIAAAGAAGTAVYTPGTTCDSFDIYFLVNANQGSVLATATGGTPTACNGTSGGARSIGKVTVTAAARNATNTLTFATVTTNPVQIIGVEAFDSTTPTLRIGDGGAIGATAASWNAGVGIIGNNPASCVAAYAPDFVVLNSGINDAFLTFTTAQFIANMGTLISQYLALGAGVMVLPPVPSAPGDARLPGETSYASALPGLCAGLGATYVDTFNAWGGVNAYNTLNPLGYYADTFHPSVMGYSDLGRVIAAAMMAY